MRRDPSWSLVVGHLDQQLGGQTAFEARERSGERIDLGLVAREPVEDEAVARVALADAFGDHADYHLVGDEIAGVHVALGALSELGAFGDLGAKDVARGDVRQAEVVSQAVGLGALAGTRRAEQDQVQLGQDGVSLIESRTAHGPRAQRNRPGRPYFRKPS